MLCLGETPLAAVATQDTQKQNNHVRKPLSRKSFLTHTINMNSKRLVWPYGCLAEWVFLTNGSAGKNPVWLIALPGSTTPAILYRSKAETNQETFPEHRHTIGKSIAPSDNQQNQVMSKPVRLRCCRENRKNKQQFDF